MRPDRASRLDNGQISRPVPYTIHRQARPRLGTAALNAVTTHQTNIMTPEDIDSTAGSGCSAPTCSASFSSPPWVFDGEQTIIDQSGFHVAFVNEYASSFGDDLHKRNAQLIAAAPKMLEALRFYAAHMKLGYGITDSGQVAEDAIREAFSQNPSGQERDSVS